MSIKNVKSIPVMGGVRRAMTMTGINNVKYVHHVAYSCERLI